MVIDAQKATHSNGCLVEGVSSVGLTERQYRQMHDDLRATSETLHSFKGMPAEFLSSIEKNKVVDRYVDEEGKIRDELTGELATALFYACFIPENIGDKDEFDNALCFSDFTAFCKLRFPDLGPEFVLKHLVDALLKLRNAVGLTAQNIQKEQTNEPSNIEMIGALCNSAISLFTNKARELTPNQIEQLSFRDWQGQLVEKDSLSATTRTTLQLRPAPTFSDTDLSSFGEGLIRVPDELAAFYKKVLSAAMAEYPPVIPNRDTEKFLTIVKMHLRGGENGASHYESLRGENIQAVMEAVVRGDYAKGDISASTILSLIRQLSSGITSDRPDELWWRHTELKEIGGRDMNQVVAVEEIPSQLASLLESVNSLTPAVDSPLETAAKIATAFQRIHATFDYSGRLGHIVTCIALQKMGQAPFRSPLGSNKLYVSAVNEAMNENYDQLIQFIQENQVEQVG